MLTLLNTPNGRRLVQSTTKRQAVDHVVKGTITAKTINADELADLLAEGMIIEKADYADPVVEEAANKAETTDGAELNEGGENGAE